MKQLKGLRRWLTILGAASVLLSPVVMAGERLTMVGIVNEDRQFMDDRDRVYTIGDNETGRALRQQMDRRIRVTGTIETVDGETVFMVTSYKIIEE